jgi:raffinose/stachyose/melibiose transport system substrate-binding protein
LAGKPSTTRAAVLAAACAVFALALGASEARPAGADSITITMLAISTNQAAYQVLIPNFERVYPNITVNATYISSSMVNTLEPTELATGSAPDLIADFPGSTSPTSVARFAQAGLLAPLVNVPWAKRSLPAITSLSKNDGALYVFSPQVSPYGVFTNDTLFAKLGLKVPQTFAQLIALCGKAKAAGTVAMINNFGDGGGPFLRQLAIATVYANDKHWTRELKAGTVSFDGTPGWHQALQELVDMNDAGCFEPGASAILLAGAEAGFAEGQGLMMWSYSGIKGVIDGLEAQFKYSFAPFPGGTSPTAMTTYLHLSSGLSINAHSSPQNQAAALMFINFIARPKQNALYTQVTGGLTGYQWLKGQLPPFMSAFAPVLANNRYIVDPAATWTGSVGLVETNGGTGLLTGQSTVDGVLTGMDAAWQTRNSTS